MQFNLSKIIIQVICRSHNIRIESSLCIHVLVKCAYLLASLSVADNLHYWIANYWPEVGPMYWLADPNCLCCFGSRYRCSEFVIGQRLLYLLKMKE